MGSVVVEVYWEGLCAAVDSVAKMMMMMMTVDNISELVTRYKIDNRSP